MECNTMQCRFSMDVIKCDIICFVKKCGGKHSYMFKNVKVSKKRIFYSLADRKGGGGVGHWAAPLAQTVSKCENFDPFFPLKCGSLILKTHLMFSEGSQECILRALYASTLPLSNHFVTEQQQTVRDWMKIRFFTPSQSN